MAAEEEEEEEGLLVGRVAAEELEGVLTRTAQSNITGRRCNAC